MILPTFHAPVVRRISQGVRPAALALGCLLSSHLAYAQNSDPQKATTAQALYDHATSEMDAGNYAAACPKLEEVVRLVPDGLGGRLTLAECYEAEGKLASAWSQYALVEAAAVKADRTKLAAAKAAALKPKLSKLTFAVPENVRSIPSIAVTRDGQAVSAVEWGTPLPVDSGGHDIEVTAPGHKTWKQHVEVPANAATVVVDIPVLEVETSAPPPATAAAPPPPPPPAPAPLVPPEPKRTWQRPLGIAGMGIGAAGLVVGGVLGGLALSKKGDSNAAGADYCNASNVCGSQGLALRSSALGLGNGSTAAFAAGGVFLVAGVVLFATAPSAKKSDASAKLEVAPSGIRLGGTW